MRVLIVDDEPLARRRLMQLLAAIPEIEIVGEAGSGREALKRVELLRPDVLLLDIEMPAVDGFAVLKALPPERAPAIVFVTAFQDHAVKAFELRATDFVVKPVSGDRLAKAIEQARSDLDARRAGERQRTTTSSSPFSQRTATTGGVPPYLIALSKRLERICCRLTTWPERSERFFCAFTASL